MSLATDPIIQSYMYKLVVLTVIRMDYVYLLSPSWRLNVGFLLRLLPDNPTNLFLMLFI
ncbi:hypothetical protein [Paenibacillus taichungensis]|uniref:hypothetical protein n=1 Tax=Paenibacillus taichungensis TaxID=484184 RepID=UPI003D9A35DC